MNKNFYADVQGIMNNQNLSISGACSYIKGKIYEIYEKFGKRIYLAKQKLNSI